MPRATSPLFSGYRPLAAPARRGPQPTSRQRWGARGYAAYLVLRGLLLLGCTSAGFVVASAVAGAWLSTGWARAAAGLCAMLVVPILLRRKIARAVARRTGRAAPRLGGAWFVLACNGVLLLAVGLGFSDAVGRSLRRRGDWFIGELDGPLPRRYRGLVAAVSGWLEHFDVPLEARPLLEEAAVAELDRQPLAGGTPLAPRPPAARWLHPLLGPRRALPPNAACRFGAPRPGPRPPECERGHCGIDLVQPEGSPVHAVSDGVVVRVERDEVAGGIAGRFIILGHASGTVRSYYVHLQALRTDLRPGTRLRGGDVIGTVGQTGTRNSAPHLHFALAVQRPSGQLYIDPEPLVGDWALPRPARPLLANIR